MFFVSVVDQSFTCHISYVPNSYLPLVFPCYKNDRLIICENAPGDTSLLVCVRLRSESRIAEGKATQSFGDTATHFQVALKGRIFQCLPSATPVRNGSSSLLPFITLSVSILSNLNVIVLLYVFHNTICMFFSFLTYLERQMQIVKLPAFELKSLPLDVQKVVS